MKQFLPIGLSPNVETGDVWQALNRLVRPWRYQVAPEQTKLQHALADFFAIAPNQVWLFNSGRSALLTYLRSLQLPDQSEVLLQAFTCNAVVNPILWSNLKPVYVDIEPKLLTMSPPAVRAALTPQTKAIIIQHTFGQPAAFLSELLAIAREHNLIVIEDCAHALGATTTDNRLLGSYGDAALLSFGRDKVISSVYGGALVVNAAQHQSAVNLYYQNLKFPRCLWTLQQLLHPIITRLAIITWYWLGCGRGLFVLAQRCHILSLAVSQLERNAVLPDYFPKKLPGALAALALYQFKKLARFNNHRRAIAQVYDQILYSRSNLAQGIFLRYTVRSQKRQELFNRLKAQGVVLGDWYWNVIVPSANNLSRFGYVANSCPQAEVAAECVLNLPTHIHVTPDLARTIAEQVKPYI